ncbi:pyridoxamine 5'-phosphate oxidase family protein [Corynebacterium caspium]|uniref:pyridoxamine 5'-phosphate oxidase family protein n=1 Tax=Corynebacterium caspium TaxID=234828 RepID=UPI00036BEEB2|nr:pyridoxamine 5'-phosphate oxidase family protein [Corynebacterium caspium]
MTTENDAIVKLTTEESLAKLRSESLGRVVVHRSAEMDIFPVNYVLDADNRIYFRTGAGNKLFTINLNHDVLFEADHVERHADSGTAWSVVVRGNARLVDTNKEIAHAESLPLKPWVPTIKQNYVCITIESINGRRFVLGPEPELY